MNIERIRRVADAIEKAEDMSREEIQLPIECVWSIADISFLKENGVSHFYMPTSLSTVKAKDSGNTCGSVGCIAGFTLVEFFDVHNFKYFDQYIPRAAFILGISDQLTSEALFDPASFTDIYGDILEDIWPDTWNELGGLPYIDNMQINSRRAVSVLRKIKETDKAFDILDLWYKSLGMEVNTKEFAKFFARKDSEFQELKNLVPWG